MTWRSRASTSSWWTYKIYKWLSSDYKTLCCVEDFLFCAMAIETALHAVTLPCWIPGRIQTRNFDRTSARGIGTLPSLLFSSLHSSPPLLPFRLPSLLSRYNGSSGVWPQKILKITGAHRWVLAHFLTQAKVCTLISDLVLLVLRF